MAFKPTDAKDIADASKKILDGFSSFAEGAESTGMELLGALGKLSPVAGIASGIFGIVNLFTPNTYQQQVLGYLKNIDHKLDLMDAEIKAGFKQVENLIKLEFLKTEIGASIDNFNKQINQIPLKNKTIQKDGTTKERSADLWSEFHEYSKSKQGTNIFDFYHQIKELEMNTLITGAMTFFTGNPDKGYSEVKNSLLGLLVTKAIYYMDTSGGDIKDTTSDRGCLDPSFKQRLLDNYSAIESFFYSNFMVQLKAFKLWHDTMLYYHARPYPVKGTNPVSSSNNVHQVIEKDSAPYQKNSLPEFICVGQMPEYDANNEVVNTWYKGILSDKNIARLYDQAFYKEYQNGAPSFLFIPSHVLLEFINVQENLHTELDLFQFQVERLVVSQLNQFAYLKGGPALGDYVDVANEILARASYIRESFLGNVQPNKANEEPTMLTGRVLLPNNVTIEGATICSDLEGKDIKGHLGNPTAKNYQYGYGPSGNGYGYQFPVLGPDGNILPYKDSHLSMYAFSFPPGSLIGNSPLSSMVPANKSVMMTLKGGNFNGSKQGAGIYKHTVEIGQQKKTLYSFFATPVFGGLNMLGILPNKSYNIDTSQNGDKWADVSYSGDISNVPASTDPCKYSASLSAENPGNHGINFGEVISMNTILPITFEDTNEENTVYFWQKASLTIQITWTDMGSDAQELVFTINRHGYPSFDIYAFNYFGSFTGAHGITDNDDIGKISDSLFAVMPVGGADEMTVVIKTANKISEGSSCIVNDITIDPLLKTTPVISVALNMFGELGEWGIFAQGGKHTTWHPFNFRGSFSAQLEIDEIRVFWDMPDTTDFNPG